MADKARVQAVVEQLVASEAKVSECKVHVLLELVKYSVLTCKENGRHVPWDKWCYVHAPDADIPAIATCEWVSKELLDDKNARRRPQQTAKWLFRVLVFPEREACPSNVKKVLDAFITGTYTVQETVQELGIRPHVADLYDLKMDTQASMSTAPSSAQEAAAASTSMLRGKERAKQPAKRRMEGPEMPEMEPENEPAKERGKRKREAGEDTPEAEAAKRTLELLFESNGAPSLVTDAHTSKVGEFIKLTKLDVSGSKIVSDFAYAANETTIGTFAKCARDTRRTDSTFTAQVNFGYTAMTGSAKEWVAILHGRALTQQEIVDLPEVERKEVKWHALPYARNASRAFERMTTKLAAIVRLLASHIDPEKRVSMMAAAAPVTVDGREIDLRILPDVPFTGGSFNITDVGAEASEVVNEHTDKLDAKEGVSALVHMCWPFDSVIGGRTFVATTAEEAKTYAVVHKYVVAVAPLHELPHFVESSRLADHAPKGYRMSVIVQQQEQALSIVQALRKVNGKAKGKCIFSSAKKEELRGGAETSDVQGADAGTDDTVQRDTTVEQGAHTGTDDTVQRDTTVEQGAHTGTDDTVQRDTTDEQSSLQDEFVKLADDIVDYVAIRIRGFVTRQRGEPMEGVLGTQRLANPFTSMDRLSIETKHFMASLAAALSDAPNKTACLAAMAYFVTHKVAPWEHVEEEKITAVKAAEALLEGGVACKGLATRLMHAKNRSRFTNCRSKEQMVSTFMAIVEGFGDDTSGTNILACLAAINFVGPFTAIVIFRELRLYVELTEDVMVDKLGKNQGSLTCLNSYGLNGDAHGVLCALARHLPRQMAKALEAIEDIAVRGAVKQLTDELRTDNVALTLIDVENMLCELMRYKKLVRGKRGKRGFHEDDLARDAPDAKAITFLFADKDGKVYHKCLSLALAA